MKKSHPDAGSAPSKEFVLTSDRGEKISAVEGLKLSRRMAAILTDSRANGLTGDERRTLIKEQVSRRK